MSKRKAYRPKLVANTLLMLDLGSPLTDAERTHLGARARLHYAAFRAGQATERNAEDLANLLNIIAVIATTYSNRGKELALRVWQDAENALRRSQSHNATHGTWLLDGAGLEAFAQALDLFETMLTGLTLQQYTKATLIADQMQRDEASNPLSPMEEAA